MRLEKENKSVKNIILGDIRKLFENDEEESYYKPVRVCSFWSNNYNEYELMVIETKHYQLENILITLNHT